jgi:hypothetical protein
MSTTVDPPERLASLTAYPSSCAVLMVNLLKFRQPDGLQRYWSTGAMPRIRSAGTTPPFFIGVRERPC